MSGTMPEHQVRIQVRFGNNIKLIKYFTDPQGFDVSSGRWITVFYGIDMIAWYDGSFVETYS